MNLNPLPLRSSLEYMRTVKILIVYVIFFLVLFGMALIVEQIEGGPSTKSDTYPDPF